MENTIILPPDYKPTADEEYMNEMQLEYFRQKLLNWKKSLIGQSKDTLDDLRQGGLNQPDQIDRASLESDKALELRTRDQLLVSGYVQGEKIHVIVNHWPSRYGGELYSRPNRNAAAALTKSICDSIYKKEPKAKIIIMGDLNDDPYNESCAVVLGAKKDRKDVEPQGYFNTLWKTLDRGIGSLGYNDSWNLFDQLIISGNLAHADSNNELAFWKSEIFNRDFLIVQEGQNKGYPKRTHTSGVWTNGYSDHFPVIIYLIKKK